MCLSPLAIFDGYRIYRAIFDGYRLYRADMVAMALVLRPRDTGILRNSRLMGIPEFRSMANDLEIYRRSKVSEFGGPPKIEEGCHAYQQRFYHLLLSLLWRVCENYDDVSQTDFYKLYKWFHITRRLVKPPPPAPDYVSPFAKKKMKNEPVATIRMTTKTSALKPELTSCYAETGYNDGMRSRVDPAKYLAQGSTISLAESMNSTLRHNSPNLNLRSTSARVKQVPSDVLLQALAEPDEMSKCPTPSTTSARVLGVLRPSTGERSSTAPAGLTRQKRSNKRPNSVQNNVPSLPHFPITSRSLSSIKGRYGYEINGEIDADATFVDIDGILDAGSDIMREIVSSPSPQPPPPRATPPLPSVDVLTKRQLKLIGTTSSVEENEGVSTPHVIHAVNDVLQDTVKKSITAAERAKTTELTAGTLAELAEPIGEKMMINRARLLLLQHSPGHLIEKQPPKPPTAPPCFRRPCPSPLLESYPSQAGMDESRSTYVNYERATTAPSFRNPPNTPKPVQPAIRIRRGSKPRVNVVPRKGEREDAVMSTFTVQPVYPAARSETRSPFIHPVPPPSTSSLSSFHEHVWVPAARTPHSERCSIYKDPVQEDHGYTPLMDDEHTLSETPLIPEREDPFSSLSSFLPSTQSLVNAL